MSAPVMSAPPLSSSGDSLPACAVLLAAYEGAQWIDAQVESILKQTDVLVTLFISVDLSRDLTLARCQALALAHPQIHLLPYGERYGSAAQNFFRLFRDVDFSGFDAIALADQDDVWFADKLARACRQLAAGYAAYSSNVIAHWPSGKQQLIDKSQAARTWDFLFEAAGPGCTYVLTAELAKATQTLLREASQEGSALQAKDVALHDWLIYAFARSQGFTWYMDPIPGLMYRQHQHNHLGANAGWLAYRARLFRFLSGDWLQQAQLIARLCGLAEHEFVRGWARLDRSGLLFLLRHFNQCRRRLRDRWVFFALCFLLFLRGLQPDRGRSSELEKELGPQ